MPDLRRDFFEEMEKLASTSPQVRLIVGDLGYSFMETYAGRYPAQFLNFGIAEQAMIGVAAGMARAGLQPFVYSGAIFAIMRPYEQVRDDIAYNNTNVKIIGTGASQFLGFTHNMLNGENEEDLLKHLPNLKRFYPKDREELAAALRTKGPAYIRL